MSYSLQQQLNQTQFETAFCYLSERSYWAKGVTRETFTTAITNSICFAIIKEQQLCAFARVVTDQATFANLLDVFVIEQHRGKGLSKMLLSHIMQDPRLQGLRRFTLATKDAHSLYQKFNFTQVEKPQGMMEIYRPYT